ncbi:MAG: hypothetical protein H7Y60_02560 [Rhodospirillaceae bacterium]|nr:hypothetical protein [Rhodospirillales bacterium]
MQKRLATQIAETSAVTPAETGDSSVSENTHLLALQAQYRDHISALNQNSMTSIPFDLSQIYQDTADIKELTDQLAAIMHRADARPYGQSDNSPSGCAWA